MTETTDTTIRLLIADDHALIREGFKNLLSTNPDIDLVGCAANGKEALALAEQADPHVIIMDIKMPVMCGKEACLTLKQRIPHINVIAFSMFDDEQNLTQMRLAGARGYLLKNADVAEVYKAIRVVKEGGEYYSEAIRSRINGLYKNGNLGRAIYEKKDDYTDIEIKIIQLLCKELSSKEIADQLNLSKRTIEHHKEKIQEKMGVQTSVGIAVYALNNWLLC